MAALGAAEHVHVFATLALEHTGDGVTVRSDGSFAGGADALLVALRRPAVTTAKHVNHALFNAWCPGPSVGTGGFFGEHNGMNPFTATEKRVAQRTGADALGGGFGRVPATGCARSSRAEAVNQVEQDDDYRGGERDDQQFQGGLPVGVKARAAGPYYPIIREVSRLNRHGRASRGSNSDWKSR